MSVIFNRFSDFYSQYNLFLFDLWGVTHNGQVTFPGALDCLKFLKSQNKSVIFLSNAPRMPEVAINRLTEMGIERELYHALYSSGYECHIFLRNRPNEFYQKLGNNLLHIGPQRDCNLFETLDYQQVKSIQDADFLLITGTEKWDATVDDFKPLLKQALEKNLPLVCANSDKRVMYGQDMAICGGAIASHYQEMGGNVYQHGKPNSSVYEAAHLLANQALDRTINKTEILMIGDSLATDIKGANNYQIDSLMVLSGIHGNELNPFIDKSDIFKEKLDKLSSNYQAQPTYIMEKLEC